MNYNYDLLNEVQKQLANFQSSDDYSDVTLIVDGENFKSHKVFLAAASEYFRLLFRYDTKSEIEIKGVSSLSFRNVISFLYKNTLNFDGIEELKDILATSDLFQIATMKTSCEYKIIPLITEENCMDIYTLSQTFNCSNLPYNAKAKMLLKPEKWLARENIKNLNEELLGFFLSSDSPEVNEDMAYEALVAWVAIDSKNREEKFCKNFANIRLPILDQKYFKDHVEINKHVKNCEKCQEYASVTAKYFADGNEDDLRCEQLRARGEFSFPDEEGEGSSYGWPSPEFPYDESDDYGSFDYYNPEDLPHWL